MKSHFPIKSGMTLATLFGIALATGMFVFRAQADEWDKKTVLTVDQPIQVTNTVLEPGKYVLKLANSSSDRHIVQIFNGDQTRIIDTVLAIPNYRLQPTGNSQFTFWETPPGTARALRAWFYPGDNFGQEFRYPKQLTQIALLQKPQLAPAPPPAPAPSVAEPPRLETPPPPQPAPQALKQESPQQQPPVEIAQNNSPPAPAPEAQPAPRQEQLPEQLPKTASPYPRIGLAGLVSLGLYGLLRVKRLA